MAMFQKIWKNIAVLYNVSKLGTEHSSGGEGWFRQIRLGAGLSGEHKPNMRRKRWTGQRCQPWYWSLEQAGE